MNMDPDIRIGILGGSGLYEMEALTNSRDVSLDTPFGAPSGPYRVGRLGGIRVAFLPRHGHGHLISPSELNFQANIYGFKKLGVEHIISVTAVGSLKACVCATALKNAIMTDPIVIPPETRAKLALLVDKYLKE